MKKFNKYIILASLIILTSCKDASKVSEISGNANVHDGDTMEINGIKIRLLGIDAPELKQVCYKNRQKYNCGEDAAEYLKQLTNNKQINCVKHNLDKYNRTVAQCSIGKDDINAKMVSAGWALAYTQYSEAYIKNEQYAKSKKLGIHSGSYIKPWDFRKAEKNSSIITTTTTTGKMLKSCKEARASGKTPVLKGDARYNPRLDGDKDGKICE